MVRAAEPHRTNITMIPYIIVIGPPDAIEMDIVAATAIQLLQMFHPVAMMESTESSVRVAGSRPMWARGLFSTLPAELDISVES